MVEGNAKARLAELTALLKSHGEPWRAEAVQRDRGSAYPFLAIRVPVLRRIATKEFSLRDLSPAERLAVWDYVWWHAEFYEVMSIPLYYYQHRKLKIDDVAFETIKHWVKRVDDWAHCDSLSAVYSYLNHNRPDVVMPFLADLNRSSLLWKIRTSIVSLIHYSGKNATYLPPDRVFPFLDPHLSNGNKYIANAVGWVLREMRQRYPVEIDAYVREKRAVLSSVARRKAKITL